MFSLILLPLSPEPPKLGNLSPSAPQGVGASRFRSIRLKFINISYKKYMGHDHW